MYISGTIEKSHKKACNFVKGNCDSSRNSQHVIIIIIAHCLSITIITITYGDSSRRVFFQSAFNRLIKVSTDAFSRGREQERRFAFDSPCGKRYLGRIGCTN